MRIAGKRQWMYLESICRYCEYFVAMDVEGYITCKQGVTGYPKISCALFKPRSSKEKSIAVEARQ